jgi:hypothetical protein
VFVLEAVENCLDGGRGGEGDGYMSVSIGGDDSGQPTDGSLWGCSCGGSARERVVGATCSGVIRMAEVPRGRLGQGRFLNRLRFAEVNAGYLFRSLRTGQTHFSLSSLIICAFVFTTCPAALLVRARVLHRQQYSTATRSTIRRPRLASRYRVFLRSPQLHLHTTHL